MWTRIADGDFAGYYEWYVLPERYIKSGAVTAVGRAGRERPEACA